MGVGYWVWLIPLGSGSTSVGIVVDATIHPYARLNRFDRALDWLREFEPQCAEVVKAHEPDLEDFLALRGFAYGCSRVFSPDRWALVGEAGLFTDPFYSPGSDFIAMGNDYAVDLIRRDHAGEDVTATGRAVQHDLPSSVRGVPAAVRGAVPDHGQRPGDDRQGGLGQRLLLGDDRAAVLPAAISPAGVHRVDRAVDAPVLRAARAHAAVPEGLEPASTPATTAPASPASWRPSGCAGCRPTSGSRVMDDAALRARLDANFALLERFARALQAIASRRIMERVPSWPGFLCERSRFGTRIEPSVRRRPAARRQARFRIPLRIPLRIPPEGGNYRSRICSFRL